ncbi:hypothetical protein [Propionicicella superfundia]|uniref:hypothetical protein n=1 Tax=Propionicicella superfundia TaxID=348582 RepID=UPI0004103E9A|nr:hypothetical protein [Propionicicella superfundia]
MPVLQLDPNSVQAGALPLFIVLGLAVVIALGFFNMRSHMRKITAPSQAEVAGRSAHAAEPEVAGPGSPATAAEDRT